jgi:hypothetical protein
MWIGQIIIRVRKKILKYTGVFWQMISRQVFFMIDDGPKDYGNFDF